MKISSKRPTTTTIGLTVGSRRTHHSRGNQSPYRRFFRGFSFAPKIFSIHQTLFVPVTPATFILDRFCVYYDQG